MTAPQTYAQWSDWLDRLSQGIEDDLCLSLMAAGQMEWSGPSAKLFAQRLTEEYNRRLTHCAARLTQDLRVGSSELAIVRAILDARSKLAFLDRLGRSPVLPQLLATHLQDEVNKYAQRAQSALEDSAKMDRTGHLATLLRNNSLMRYRVADSGSTPSAATTAPAKGLPIPPPAQTQAPQTQPVGMRRRNIII